MGANASTKRTAWQVVPPGHSPSAWQAGSLFPVQAAKHAVLLKSANRSGAGHVVLVFKDASAALVAARQHIVPVAQRRPFDDVQPSSFSPPRQPDDFARQAPWPLMQHRSVDAHEVPSPHGTSSLPGTLRPVVQPVPASVAAAASAGGAPPSCPAGVPESGDGAFGTPGEPEPSSLPQPAVEDAAIVTSPNHPARTMRETSARRIRRAASWR